MTIVSLGISHRIASPKTFEKLAVSSAQRGGILARLLAVPAIDEVAVLSTCKRVEVYAATRGPAGPIARAVADVLGAHARVETREVLRVARVRVGDATAKHLFIVACGLDSMAIGEGQIVAQIKDASRAAAAAGTAGPVLTGLIDAALRVSKRARAQTTMSTEGISRHLADWAVPGQIPQARAVIAAETATYPDRQDQANAAAVIAAMQARVRQLADAELARLRRRLPDLSEDQQAEMAASVYRILLKVLHQPTVRAEEFSTGPNGPAYLDALRQLFDLRTGEAGSTGQAGT